MDATLVSEAVKVPSTDILRDADFSRLLAEAQRRPEAFARLYDHHFQAVWRFVSGHVGERLASEDLVSEVFLRALKGLPRFMVGELPAKVAFAAWLFGIARNVVNDYHRHRPRGMVQLDQAGEIVDRSSAGPEEDMLAKEEAIALRAAVARLPDEQQDVIALRYFVGLSVAETADVLGKTEGAVRVQAFRAIARLREMLTRKESDSND